MARKVIIIADPGIDTSFAIALALHDANLDVIGLIPTAGNVAAEQATANVLVLIDQLDPEKWPRTANALAVTYEIDGLAQHGPNGLGGVTFPMTTRHQQPNADKAIIDLVRQNPHEVTILNLGPATTLAQAFVRDPELPMLVDRVIFVGGGVPRAGQRRASGGVPRLARPRCGAESNSSLPFTHVDSARRYATADPFADRTA